ncbi:hypothetical protein QJS10_CPA01g01939 [Acorus calamus]|uniref:TF-B3 domain-containing protein n=1 Tax=Acorus calamus TaxID=4465 RepID=A0AAV9FGY7_ACOCL|nr:hypothetical protein QJS10_CPA01g01939 [Acorus calamus]
MFIVGILVISYDGGHTRGYQPDFIGHLPPQKAKMILWDPMGCSWTVNYIPSKDDNLLSGGWTAFMRATNLEVGDLCLFELIKPLEIKAASA